GVAAFRGILERHGGGPAAANGAGRYQTGLPFVAEPQHGVMSEGHCARGAGNNMPLVNRSMAIAKADELGNLSRANRGLHPQPQVMDPRGATRTVEDPVVAGCLAVGRVMLAAVRSLIPAKWHAEKIAAQDAEHG